MSAPEQPRTIDVIGVPLDHGAGRRGVGMGPAAIRIAGLHAALARLGHTATDKGDLEIPAPETMDSGNPKAKFLPLIAEVCTKLSESVERTLAAGKTPLVLGGDHSIAVGTISGLAASLEKRRSGSADTGLGVIWFDAHGDINTPETSPSGNVHGMPLACLLGNGPAAMTQIGFAGRKVNPKRVAQIGLRDIDATERRLLRESGIHAYTMSDIDRRGIAKIMAEAIEFVTDGTELVHCSFDIDSVDPKIAPGTGTTKAGGLTFREAHLALEMLAETGRLSSMELVEVNPTLDLKNMTAQLAVDLIASAFGAQIL